LELFLPGAFLLDFLFINRPKWDKNLKKFLKRWVEKDWDVKINLKMKTINL